MPDSPTQLRLGRDYLETYYPSVFDEEAFHKALSATGDWFCSEVEPLNVVDFSVRYGLAPEVIENAAILYHLLRVADAVSRDWQGKSVSVIDIGGGPTIYQHIPMSLVADIIIHAEPLLENRAEVLQYIRNENAYDWNAYFRVVRRYLETSSRFPGLSQRLNEISKVISGVPNSTPDSAWKALITGLIDERVVPCDVFQKNLEFEDRTDFNAALLGAGVTNGATVVESNFLLESATDSLMDWSGGLDTIVGAVAPGGFLSMMAIRNADWYLSGVGRIPAVPVEESFLRRELKGRSFSIIWTHVLTGSDKKTIGYDGMAFVLARKNMS